MSARTALISTRLTAPKFKYSQLIKAGPHYVCSGMVALDNDSGELVNGGVAEQTSKIFSNLSLLMEEFDLSLDELVNVRIFTTNFDEFAEINKIWEEIFRESVPPARSSVGVSALPLNAMVEIEFWFYYHKKEYEY